MPAPIEARQFAKKGSQRWLQVAVDKAPGVLDEPINAALGLATAAQIDWLSPLRRDRFREYRDSAAFDKCELPLSKRALADFWPSGGPVWDGLARASDNAVLFVEAKAHIPEIVSPRTQATEPARGKIVKSIREVQKSIAPRSVDKVDWTNTFYQYTNRIAYLHFLREDNGIDAHLVNVYFTNAADVGGPTSRCEWDGALQVVESYLGLSRHRLSRFVHKVFVDVSPLVALAESA